MKSSVVFFDDENEYENIKAFGKEKNLSSVDCSNLFFEELKKKNPEIQFNKHVIYRKKCTNIEELFSQLQNIIQKDSSNFIIYSFIDLPFMNLELTQKILKNHLDYKCEYTFADAYPYGFAPEIIHSDTVKILFELCKTNQKEFAQKKVNRESVFDLIKTDINSFDVESVLALEDFRLLRLNFCTGTKLDFTTCKEFYEFCHTNNLPNLEDIFNYEDLDSLCQKAIKNPRILKTLPSFYNIQISENENFHSQYMPYSKVFKEKYGILPDTEGKNMDFNTFSQLFKEIKDFSAEGVISFSLFGEALKNPEILDFVKLVLDERSFSVFIETDGLEVTEKFCLSLKEILDNALERTNNWPKLMIAVKMDAFTDETYKKIHNTQNSLQEVITAFDNLYQVNPGNVYPQFVRMNTNEAELESFFRYWNEKTSKSGGNLIIQKYDDFCGLLPECKPADLSPVDRFPCWHLRRDMNILVNGDVILCRECLLSNVIGNVFKEHLDKVWAKSEDLLKAHILEDYKQKCGMCDEFYTFNF